MNDLIPISHCPALLSSITGETHSAPSIYRWARHGIKGVRLQTTWAKKLMTCEAWLREFMDSVAEAKLKIPVQLSRSLQRRHDAAVNYVLAC